MKDTLLRQVVFAPRDADDEGATLAQHTVDANRAGVLPDQLVHQREPDAGAFKAAAGGALNAMEAIEDLGPLVFGDAGSGVPNRELEVVPGQGLAHSNLSFQSKLEGVGQ